MIVPGFLGGGPKPLVFADCAVNADPTAADGDAWHDVTVGELCRGSLTQWPRRGIADAALEPERRLALSEVRAEPLPLGNDR